MMIQKIDIKDRKNARKVLRLQKEAYKVEVKYLDSYRIPPLMETVDSLIESNEHFYGYFENERLIGVTAYEIEDNAFILSRVMVSPKHFRKGVASTLIHYVLQLEPNMEKYYVTTGAKNEPALRLYKKFGFKEVSHFQVVGIHLTKLMKTNV